MSDNKNTSTYQEKIAEFYIDGMNVLPDKNYKALSQVTVQPATNFLEMLQGTHSQLTDDDIPSSVDEVTLGPVCSSFTSINISKPKKVILKTELPAVETLNVHNAIIEVQSQEPFFRNNVLTEIRGNGLILGSLTFSTSTGYGYFSKITTIPPVINEVLPDSAFNTARELTTVSIENATNIPDYCFSGCQKLQNINFKKGITGTRIGNYAFYWCQSLTIDNFVIPSGITEIGERAFYRCHQIKNFTFPESLINIGKEAFSACTALQTITVRGNSSCATAQTLQAMTPSQYNNATIVYTEN